MGKQGLTRPVPGHLAECTVALGKEQRSDMIWVLVESLWLLLYDWNEGEQVLKQDK